MLQYVYVGCFHVKMHDVCVFAYLNTTEANPEKFNKRYKNKWQYFQLGQKDFWQRKFSDLTDYITLHVKTV